MRLEDKFFNIFFYPFLFGIISSIIIVIVILSYYSKGYLDKTTANDVYKVETKYARNNIYSASILLTDLLLKVKLVVEEQLSLFQFIEKSLNLSENNKNRKLKDIYNVWDTPENNEELKKRLDYASLWFVDPETKDPEQNKDLFNQLFLFSLMTQSLYAGHNSLKGLVLSFYFIFEDTNLFITYPYKYYWENDNITTFLHFTSNPSWCTDYYGNKINYYNFRCRGY